MKPLPIVAAFIGLAFPNAVLAQWWNPFGPSNYEDCVLEGMKTARNRDAVRAVRYACLEKFPPKSRSKKEIEAESAREEELRKKCKIPEDADENSLLGINSKRPRIIDAVNNLTRLKLENSAYGSPKISFQNRNDFSVTSVAIGFTNKKQCPTESDSPDYEATVICADTNFAARGVGAGTYGSLLCQDEAKNFQMGYCAVGIRVEDPVSRNDLAQILNRYGLCD